MSESTIIEVEHSFKVRGVTNEIRTTYKHLRRMGIPRGEANFMMFGACMARDGMHPEETPYLEHTIKLEPNNIPTDLFFALADDY